MQPMESQSQQFVRMKITRVGFEPTTFGGQKKSMLYQKVRYNRVRNNRSIF